MAFSLEQATAKAPNDVLGKLMLNVLGLRPLIEPLFLPCPKTLSDSNLRQVKELLGENRHGFGKKYDVFSIQRLKFQKIIAY